MPDSMCPGTWIQFRLARYHRLIDDYPILVPALSIAGALIGLAWIAFSVLLFVKWLG